MKAVKVVMMIVGAILGAVSGAVAGGEIPDKVSKLKGQIKDVKSETEE